MGYLDEEDKKKSTVNLMLMTTIFVGFTMFGYAIYKKVDQAFIPLGTIITAAVAGFGIKANKGSS